MLPIRIIIALATLSLASAPHSYANSETKIPSEQRFDFTFEGGTALDLLAALEPQQINFILPETADQLKIPSFTVKNVTPADLFDALNLLTNKGQDYRSNITRSRGDIWVLQMQEIIKSNPVGVAPNAVKKQDRVNRVAQEIQDRRGLRAERAKNNVPSPTLVTKAVNISQHLKRSSIEGISSLIQSTIAAKSDLAERAEILKIDVRFHRETNVLVLSGQEEAVNLATETLFEILLSDPRPDLEEKR